MQRIDQGSFAVRPGQYQSPYGTVIYTGKNKNFKTRAHDSSIEEILDHEGEFVYEFSNEAGTEARLQIRTRLDLEFFLARPQTYEVYNPAGKLLTKPKPAELPELPKPKPTKPESSESPKIK